MCIFIGVMLLWGAYMVAYFTMRHWGDKLPTPYRRRMVMVNLWSTAMQTREVWARVSLLEGVWWWGGGVRLVVVNLWSTAMQTREVWARVSGYHGAGLLDSIEGRWAATWQAIRALA